MAEFEKKQDEGKFEEGGKPAFDQFDKEKGEQQQQGEIKKQDELAGTEKDEKGLDERDR